MRRTRILIFSLAYEPLIGGAELAVRNITDRLPSYDFDLITARLRPGLPSEERLGQVNVYRVGFGGRLGRYLYPAFAFRKAKILQKKQPYQVVWAIMAAYGAAAALMFLRRFPETKFLLTLQEGDPIEHIHKRVRGFKKFWQEAFRRADRIQAISRFLAEWARAEGAECPIDIVPNGVDVEKFKIHPPRRTKVESSSQNSEFRIITASRLVSKNGVDTLIEAVAELQTRIPRKKIRLLIAGSGPLEKSLKELAAKLKVAESVGFLGDVRHDDLAGYFSEVDIFVRPSRSEGLGSAFLEAMAAGLPVIGTAVGGIVDFITPPGAPVEAKFNKLAPTGLFADVDNPKDLADKMSQLMNNRERLIELARNGRKLVEEKYSWEQVSKQMGGVFNTLIR